MTSKETLHSALLRVYKNALSPEQITTLQSLCDLTNPKLQVFSTVDVNDNEEIVQFEKSIQLSINALSESDWLSFPDMNNIYRVAAQQPRFLRLHLAIGGSCHGVSPSQFGITTNFQTELIGYVKDEVDDKTIMSSLKSIQSNRQKRQTEIVNEGGSGDIDSFRNDTRNYSTPNSTLTNRDPSTLEEYKLAKCHLYDFNVSLYAVYYQISSKLYATAKKQYIQRLVIVAKSPILILLLCVQ